MSHPAHMYKNQLLIFILLKQYTSRYAAVFKIPLSMSMGSIEPRPISRTGSGSIIVYDPAKQTLSVWKRKRLDMRKAIETIQAPKWRSRLDVYLKHSDSETERLAATLSLDTLGWTTNVKRALGQISHVCVMESPEPGPKAIMGEA